MFSRIAQSFKKETAPPTSKIRRSTRNMSSKPSTTTMFRGLPVIPDETYTTNTPRKISKSFLAAEVEEGVGMRVRRGIGLSRLPHLSPFIMLDHFNSTFGNDRDASAPDHPHRVNNTISFTLALALPLILSFFPKPTSIIVLLLLTVHHFSGPRNDILHHLRRCRPRRLRGKQRHA